ncbi:MAG: hypothetical protein RLZZ435_2556 [Cyanobacteriota bacterium]
MGVAYSGGHIAVNFGKGKVVGLPMIQESLRL